MNLGERIKLIRGDVSRDKFAPRLKVSKNTLVNYETDVRIPDAVFLNKLLDLYPDISPTWLLTGQGEIKLTGGITTADHFPAYNPNQTATGVSEELLQAVLEAVEDYLESVDGQLPANKKAQLVAMLYDMCTGSTENKVDKATVIRLVKLAA